MDMPVPQPSTSLEQRQRSESLCKLWDGLKAKSITRTETSFFSKFSKKFENVNDNLDSAMDAGEPIASALSCLDDGGQFSQFIDPFIEIMNELSTLRFWPFKAMYAAEKKRKENHRKVVLLFV
ncbi:hypothetical protein BDP27DRAFT_389910 [Rhodocollybia butyracea]|uniref:Uncharacterized protein n=1 Tax=Rhodocollybia butyracea TaxID=206335 RepID=A0A9P5Q186_9AGAR|nr:hypothetical protein BDP27DRAFT_389910 [Rhodocollybia butyracea]